MARSISIGQLSDAVRDALEKYRDDIADGTDEAAQKAANQCLKDIKANAASAFGSSSSKPYARQWAKKQTEKDRGKSAYTVYCKKPGLPHLLEKGHAKVGGGRVAGRPHIAPAEEKAVEEFQRQVEEVIRSAGQ